MGRPASPDYWRQWRAAHPAYRERERERARARRRAGYRSPKTRRPRVGRRAHRGGAPSAADVGAGARRGPRPRGPPGPPVRRALSRRRRRDPPGHGSSGRTPWREPPPGCERNAPGATTSRRCSRRPDAVDGPLPGLRLSGLRAPHRRLRLAHDERAPLRPLRAVRASRTASAGRPTTRCDGHRPGGGWRSGRSRRTSRSTVGTVRVGIAIRTRSDPASSRPTIRCRSSSVASRCRRDPACSARAAMLARG